MPVKALKRMIMMKLVVLDGLNKVYSIEILRLRTAALLK